MSKQNIKISFGGSTILCRTSTIMCVTNSNDGFDLEKGFSPETGFIGVVTDVVKAGGYVTLNFDSEIRQVTIKHTDFEDWMQVGARLKIEWFRSLSIELISAAPTDKLSVKEVAEIFNVPPHIMGALKLS